MTDNTVIELLAAKSAIADLIHRYAQVVRYDCPEQTADLYTPDGVFEVRQGSPDRPEYEVQIRVEGREAIREALLPGKGKPHPVPMILNLLIDVDGDSAQATCVMQARMSVGEGGFWGEYRDSFVRTGGQWYFSARIYTIFTAGSPE